MIRRLIHWAGAPMGVCARKDSGADVVVRGRVTEMAVASYYGNVTCWRCRRAHNRARARAYCRRSSRAEAK